MVLEGLKKAVERGEHRTLKDLCWTAPRGPEAYSTFALDANHIDGL